MLIDRHKKDDNNWLASNFVKNLHFLTSSFKNFIRQGNFVELTSNFNLGAGDS